MNIDLIATTIALLTFFGISALMALSLNLEYGVAGVPNFGQVLFVSIGAYTTGITYTRFLPILAGQTVLDPCGEALAQAVQIRSEIMQTLPAVGLVNFVITLFISALVGGLVGYAISYIGLRLKQEWFLALVLLVGGEILRIVVRGYEPITCASNGISAVAQPFGWIADARLSAICFMILVLAFALLAYLYSERLVRSPYGRLLKAIRENDRVALSLGKNVTRVRAQVMLIGSAMAAVAGVLFAVNVGFISTNDYVVGLTLDLWVMVVLGGLGNSKGALLGALLITILNRVTAIAAIQLNMIGLDLEFNYFRYILLGIILIMVLLYRPKGLLPEPTHTTDAHEALTTQNGSDQFMNTN
ncbi:MAG: branched-chain amino acid ABC transporter permease [Candidatus Methanoperedens sp.]|nr:branched-chain amino acid ABC transporter permease [Candidatus Methanoperedens sp.]